MIDLLARVPSCKDISITGYKLCGVLLCLLDTDSLTHGLKKQKQRNVIQKQVQCNALSMC